MNFSTLIGFAAAIAVFVSAVFTATENRAIFLNEHAIIIVIGGTFSAGCICFPIGKMLKLGALAMKRMLFGDHIDYRQIIKSIIEIGDRVRNDPSYLKNEAERVKNHFLREGLIFINEGMNEDQIREIMELRVETHAKRYTIEAGIFKTLSKFPPAFGLLGTTLGMIALLQSLGGEDATKKIGPAMAIGLVATLYGISLANLVLIPIGESLSEKNLEDTTMRKIILEGVVMIKNKMHPVMIEEKLNSYLLPNERLNLKGDASGSNSGKKAA
jgi:chemotaxis protein MotA